MMKVAHVPYGNVLVNDEDMLALWAHVITKCLLVVAGALVSLPQHVPHVCAWLGMRC